MAIEQECPAFATVCLNSQERPESQGSSTGVKILKILNQMQRVNFQWVRAHCGIQENELADVQAKLSTSQYQNSTTISMMTAKSALPRHIAPYMNRNRNRRKDWHAAVFNGKPPSQPSGDPEIVADQPQLRTAHCILLIEYKNQIGKKAY